MEFGICCFYTLAEDRRLDEFEVPGKNLLVRSICDGDRIIGIDGELLDLAIVTLKPLLLKKCKSLLMLDLF